MTYNEMGNKPMTTETSRIFIYDLEVFPNYFLAMFYHIEKSEFSSFTIESLDELMVFLKQEIILVGYNNRGYDDIIRVADVSFLVGMLIDKFCYHLMLNKGWVFVGISHDTAEFSTDSIERWWRIGGKKHYSNKRHLLILADAGGSNSCRTRAWKYHLQNKLCNRHGLIVTVAHYPPGCSKWNPADRRLFSWISQNWRGVPLRTYETVLKFIRTTKTKTGLRVKSYLVRKKYKKGEKISDAQMQELDLRPNKILPQWVYTRMALT